MRETLTKTFRDAMSLIYPGGGVDPHQLTDLVRVFVMGWGEAINFYDINDASCRAFNNALEDTARESFQAGPEWRWW